MGDCPADHGAQATLRGVFGSLLAALDEVHRGDLDPKQASAMAALAGAITRAYSTAFWKSACKRWKTSGKE